MATEFKLPEIGEGVAGGTVASVLVKVGDVVSDGQPLLEIETDKAVVEVNAPHAGTITELKAKEGDSIKVGQVVGLLEAGDAPAAASEPEPESEAAPEPEPAPAPATAAPAPAAAPAAAVAAPAAAPAAKRSGGPVLASPTVRRLARKMGVSLKEVPTADPSGRVTAQDVMAYANGGAAPAAAPDAAPAAAPAAAPTPKAAAPAATGSDNWGPTAREGMNAIRKKTMERMTSNWQNIPHVTHFEKADITTLEAVRKKYGRQIEAKGGKLTVTSFIIKALTEALKRYPKFNASIDEGSEEVILKQYYNIGIAADTPNGLVVPVIKNADQKSVTELSVELPALAAKARDRKLGLDEMQGGTFTISNLGGLGGQAFTPIINAPEVAILGVSRGQIEQVYQNGQFAPRLMLPLTLSYDHRLIDGADAARFMRWLVEALEQPWVLFLDD